MISTLLKGYEITNLLQYSSIDGDGYRVHKTSCRVNGHRVEVISDSGSSMLTVFVDEDATQLDRDDAARWIAARIK